MSIFASVVVSKILVFIVVVGVSASKPVVAGTYYFHNDHLGTPQVLTDSDQVVVWNGVYEPFGSVSEISGSVVQNIRFPGQYFDEETRLHYNYFRTYDPSTGRYLQSDRLGLLSGFSTFGYALQNPVYYTDPSGDIVPVFVAAALGRAAVGTVGSFVFNTAQQWYGNGRECIDWGKALFAAGVGGVVAAASPMSSISVANTKRLKKLSEIASRNPATKSKVGRRARESFGDQFFIMVGGVVASFSLNATYDSYQRQIGYSACVKKNEC